MRRSGWVLSDGAQGIVYIDAARSTGAFEIPVGSLIRVDGGDEMSVATVNPYCVDGYVHHWEIEVR